MSTKSTLHFIASPFSNLKLSTVLFTLALTLMAITFACRKGVEKSIQAIVENISIKEIKEWSTWYEKSI